MKNFCIERTIHRPKCESIPAPPSVRCMSGVSIRLAPAANACAVLGARSTRPSPSNERRAASNANDAATREDEHAVSIAADAPVNPSENITRPHVTLASFPVPVNVPICGRFDSITGQLKGGGCNPLLKLQGGTGWVKNVWISRTHLNAARFEQ